MLRLPRLPRRTMPWPPVRRRVNRVCATLAATALLATLGTVVPTTPALAATNPPTPGDFTGLGFDQCEAPSQRAMDAWVRHSPYRAAGIYISGDSRACKRQTNLTATWVRNQLAAGWHLMPITLGPQASCSGRFPRYGKSIDPTIDPDPTGAYRAARVQALNEANKAVAAARDLGIVPGSTIFYDLEAFNIRHSTNCRMSALWFLNTWTKTLHEHGYVSGYYSSAASGIKMVDDERVNGGGRMYLPDQIWIADWDDKANTSSSYVRSDGWQPWGRLKQYQGGHNETHGGVTINIDNNYLKLRIPAAFTVPQLRVVATERTPMKAGQPASWHLTVTNVGRVSAGVVKAYAAIYGPKVSNLRMTAPGGSNFSVTAGTGSLDLGILKAGESRVVTVSGTLPRTTSGEVKLRAFAQYGNGGYGGYQGDAPCQNNTTIANDTDGCDYVYTLGVTPTPAYVRVVTFEDGPVRAGLKATWRVYLRNVGGQTATNLVVANRLTNVQAASIRSSVAGGGGSATKAGVNRVTVGKLGPGETKIVTVTANVPAGYAGRQVVDKSWATWSASGRSGYQSDHACQNNVWVSRDNDHCDYVYTNNVRRYAAKVRVLTYEPRPFGPGDVATWRIYLRNVGTAPATDLVLSSRLFGTVANTVRMAAPGGSGFRPSGDLGHLTVGSLAPGETKIVSVTARVPQKFRGAVKNKSWVRWSHGSQGYQSDHPCQNNVWVSRDTDHCDYAYRILR